MLSDKQIRILAKQVCKGNRHAMRYQPMLSACFNMAKLVLEEVEKVNIANRKLDEKVRDYFKPLEGEPLRILNHTSSRLLKENVVSTFCEKCRKPYCRCKESLIVGKAYPSLGAGIGVVISYEEMTKIFTVKYHIGKIEKVNENGKAFLVDNINPTIYDLVLNNSARILKPTSINENKGGGDEG